MVLLAGSFGALFVFFLQWLQELMRRRREREGLMVLIDMEILKNKGTMHEGSHEPPTLMEPAEIQELETDVWESVRVRLADLLSLHELTQLTDYYKVLNGIKSDARNLLRLDPLSRAPVRLEDLDDVTNAAIETTYHYIARRRRGTLDRFAVWRRRGLSRIFGENEPHR